MSKRWEIAADMDELWGELKARWKGEDSQHFYQQYISKMIETIEEFEAACSNLCVGAADLKKKLDLIERDMV